MKAIRVVQVPGILAKGRSEVKNMALVSFLSLLLCIWSKKGHIICYLVIVKCTWNYQKMPFEEAINIIGDGGGGVLKT